MGNNDGTIRYYRNGVQRFYATGVNLKIASGDVMDSFKFGWYLGNTVSTNVVDVIFDDIYLDNTWARVEIGNDAVFSSCTHREVQIPETWNGGQITFVVNQGTFQDGEDLYLFVVSPSGSASGGFPITMNSQVSQDHPGSPGQPIGH